MSVWKLRRRQIKGWAEGEAVMMEHERCGEGEVAVGEREEWMARERRKVESCGQEERVANSSSLSF